MYWNLCWQSMVSHWGPINSSAKRGLEVHIVMMTLRLHHSIPPERKSTGSVRHASGYVAMPCRCCKDLKLDTVE